MPSPLSAVESIAPAFAQTKRLLFQPFSFGVWARLAVVSVVTGEFAGGSWGGSSNLNIPAHEGGRQAALLFLSEPNWPHMQEYLPLILVGVAVLIGVGVLWIYVASVLRFVLFDAVLNNRSKLRDGWRRWEAPGGRYFLWELGFTLASLVVLVLLIGLPVYLAWRAGLFRQSDQHFALLLGGGLILFLLAIALVLLSAVVSLLAKDFLVPLMALENLGVWGGWRRLLPMLQVEKGGFAGYVLMKIVLAVGGAILFGIVNLIAILLLLIPLGALGAGVFVFGKVAGLSWNIFTLAAVVLLALAALAAILWVMGFLYAPGLVFFQSYALRFLGSRYPVLGGLLSPGGEAPPPTPLSSPA